MGCLDLREAALAKAKSTSMSTIDTKNLLSMKEKVMVTDKSGYPPYETNYIDVNQANSTLQPTISQKEPDHLMEMQTHIDQVIYDIHAKHYHQMNTEYPYKTPNGSTNSTTSKNNNEQSSYRFLEIEAGDNKAGGIFDKFKAVVASAAKKVQEVVKKGKDVVEEVEKVAGGGGGGGRSGGGLNQNVMSAMGNYGRNLGWNVVWFRSAWASSVFTYRFFWWTYSFPASNAARYWSFWCSAGFHKDDDVITWQGDFARSYRISHIWVRWGMAPHYYSLQITRDGHKWEEKKDWTDLVNNSRRSWFRRMFPWWSMYWVSWAMRIDFDHPIWIKGMRLLMKKPQHFFIAIYRVEVWTKDWVVTLLNKAEADAGKQEAAMIEGGVIHDNRRILSGKLTTALAAMDRRELFVISAATQTVILFNSYSMCLEANNRSNWNKKIHKQTRLTINRCSNREEQQWVIDHELQIQAKGNQDWCVTKSSLLLLCELEGLSSVVSSSSPDNKYCIDQALNQDQEMYWMSNLNEEHVYIQFNFHETTVQRVIIKWKYKPKGLEVKVLQMGLWHSIFATANNEVDSHDLDAGIDNIQGIQIIMTAHHDSSTIFANNLGGKTNQVYAITEIGIGPDVGYKMGLEECRSATGKEWIIEDTNYYYNAYYLYVMKYAQIYLEQKAKMLLDTLNKVLHLPKYITLILKVAQQLSDRAIDLNKALDEIDIKVVKVYDFIQEKKVKPKKQGGNGLACSSKNAAQSCMMIVRDKTYKKSGFYWIKPKCSKTALRGFCDFQVQRQGMMYAYFGGIGGDQKMNEAIKDIVDIRMQCAKLGLEPVQINHQMQLDNIRNYLKNLGVTLDTSNTIPLFYDYSCKEGWWYCRLKYGSLNKQKSPDAGKLILNNINLMINLFSLQVTDYVGFGLSKEGKLMRHRLNTPKNPIKGVVCSTNYDPNDVEVFYVLACSDVLRDNVKFSLEHSKSGLITLCKCPAGCQTKSDDVVMGNEVYSPDSFICRSAIHNGALSDEGGYVTMSVEQVKYQKDTMEKIGGADSNSIQSMDFEIPPVGSWGISFIKKTIECPMKAVRRDKGLPPEDDPPASFLQNRLRLMLKSKSLLRSQSTLKTKQKQRQKQKHKQKMKKDDDATDSNESKSGDKKEGDDEEVEQKKTNELYMEVLGELEKEHSNLKKIIRLVSDSVALNQKINEQMGPLLMGELMPAKQMKTLQSIEDHTKHSFFTIEKMTGELKGMVKEKQVEADRIYRNIQQLKMYLPYEINYHKRFEVQWKQEDYETSDNKPAKYSYQPLMRDDLKGDNWGIFQQSSIKNKDKNLASVILLKYKLFYDCVMKVSIQFKDKGSYGILFRVTDAFNYYALVLDSHKKEKRLIKVFNGKEAVLATLEDGGFVQNEWYVIALRLERGMFDVYVAKQPKKQKLKDLSLKQMEMTLYAFDFVFSSGSIGLGTNDMNQAVVDEILVEPLECTSLTQPIDTHYHTNVCNNFKESFNSYFPDTWTVKDDQQQVKAESMWKYSSTFMGKVLAQEQKYSLKGEKIGVGWLELKLNKICNEGWLMVEFMAQDDNGIVAIGFHFASPSNHYAVKIYSMAVNRCELVSSVYGADRKDSSNKDSAQKCGYTKNTKFALKIHMEKTSTTVYTFNDEIKDWVKMLSGKYEGEQWNAKIALGTFGTKVQFTKVEQLSPDAEKLVYAFSLQKQSGEAQGGGGVGVGVGAVGVGDEDGDGDGNGNGDGDGEENKKAGDKKKGGSEGEKKKKKKEEDLQQVGHNRKEKKYNEGSGNHPKDLIVFSKRNCTSYDSKAQKIKFCGELYNNVDPIAASDCLENFCDRCCFDFNSLNTLDKVVINTCKKECLGDQSKPPSKPQIEEYLNCFTFKEPKNNIYNHCQQHFILESIDPKVAQPIIHRCEMDMCQLCCLTVNSQYHTSLTLTKIKDCRMQCIIKFREEIQYPQLPKTEL